MTKITTFQNLKIPKQSGEAVTGFSPFVGKTGKEKNRVLKGGYLETDTSTQGSFSLEKALPVSRCALSSFFVLELLPPTILML